jgi:hypothetical protein
MRVTSARVLAADYDLIRRDFPTTRQLDQSGIDRWLLRHTGFIARTQIERGAPVQTPIRTNGRVVTGKAVRPTTYGRALVFQVPGGLIDGKGFGARTPAQRDHSNGLAELGEVIREFAFHQAMDTVLRHADVGLGTVGAYAVIDWGFDVVGANGLRSPAGAILRQAHNRHRDGLTDDAKELEIEQLLRRYGITSAGAHREKYKYDLINIQMDRSMTRLVDFGAFRVFDRFPARDVRGWIGRRTLVSANDQRFLQPDPSIALPPDDWAVVETTFHTDAVGRRAQELAEGLRAGTVGRGEIERFLGGLRRSVTNKLPPRRAKHGHIIARRSQFRFRSPAPRRPGKGQARGTGTRSRSLSRARGR